MSADGTSPQERAFHVRDRSAPTGTDPIRAADRLVLSADLHRQIIDHLRSALPNEGVGLLAAHLTAECGMVTANATRFFPGRNRRASPTRYDLDLRDLVRAMGEIEDAAEVLGGIVHSHPVGAPTPSVTDLAEAYYPESLMIIVSFANVTPWLRAWRLNGKPGAWQPVEVPVVES
jgi:proteasome lid subunit RPN8/RPN11